jgi:hypothetical protein
VNGSPVESITIDVRCDSQHGHSGSLISTRQGSPSRCCPSKMSAAIRALPVKSVRLAVESLAE